MKIFILLACNIFLTFIIVDYIYDPVKEFSPVNTPVYCIRFQEEGKALCGQCVSLSAELSPAKGFVIDSTNQYVSLQFPQGVSQLTCQESLHLINYHNAMKKSIHFEKMSSITQLLEQLDGVSSPRKKGRDVIQQKIQSFNVYGWYNLNQRDGVSIKIINEFYSISVMDIFFNILSILLIFLLCFTGSRLLLCTTDFSGCLAILSCAMLQIATLKYTRQWANIALFLARITTLAFYFMKLRMKGLYVSIYAILGLIIISSPLSLAIYSICAWVLMIIQGKGKEQIRLIWRYLLMVQLISTANYIYWHFMAKEDSDLICRLIEMSQFLINLAVLTIFSEDEPSTQKGIQIKDEDDDSQDTVV